MTKQEIVDIVSNATGLTKVETETIMNGVMSTIIDSLANNEKVELRGFGTFGIKHRMPKKARNPGTGEPVFLPERFVPTFKPSKLMRSRVNELIKKQWIGTKCQAVKREKRKKWIHINVRSVYVLIDIRKKISNRI